jgi:hypothetical protein
MQMLSAVELLDVWEMGLTQSPLQRAMTLLAAACPGTPPDVLAHLSIGQRDAHLLTLREWTFGPQLRSRVVCPDCCERLELHFSAAQLRATPEVEPGEALALHVAGYEVHFRLPNSQDLAAIAHYDNLAAARQALCERCLLAAICHGQPQSTAPLPPHVTDAIAARMEAADPLAAIQLALSCPGCGYQWQAAFDIASFFWSEINAWANCTLHEVHALASRYGWRERDILAMSPWRRQAYLNLVHA